MIILGNSAFATGMKLAGIPTSHVVKTREQGLAIIKGIERKEFIIANTTIVELIPELNDYPNIITIPDNAANFSSTDDLKDLIRSSIGIDIDI